MYMYLCLVWCVYLLPFLWLPGQGQVPVWEDQDIFPRRPSGLPGETAVRQAAKLLCAYAEDRARLAGKETIHENTENGYACTAIWERGSGQKVCKISECYNPLSGFCCLDLVVVGGGGRELGGGGGILGKEKLCFQQLPALLTD